MKGVILSAGKGTRLYPSSLVVQKNMLPVYNKPMILYSIDTLKKAGITEVLLVIDRNNSEQFIKFLGDGSEYGVKISYVIQEKPNGVAGALSLAEDFVGEDTLCVIFADNVYGEAQDTEGFTKGGRVFLKEVEDPERYGVVVIEDGKIVEMVEKPKEPKSNLILTGMSLYDSTVFDVIRDLKPSDRGELEITDVHAIYAKNNNIDYRVVKGFWIDAGTHDALLEASTYVKENIEKFE